MDITIPVRRETTTIYQRIADLVCRPGMPKSEMDRKVSEALNGYPLWRVRACRRGEAGCFSAAAVFSLQERFAAFLERHAARVAAAEATEQARQMATDRALLTSVLARHLAEVAKIQARLAVLGEVDPA